MFLGVVPDKCIRQIINTVDFGSWGEVYVCCSGTFRFDRAILQRWPGVKVYSNDVSLYSTPIGRFARGKETPLKFVGDLDFIEAHLKKGDYQDRIAAVLVASDYAKFRSGKPNLYKERHVEYYQENFSSLIKKTRLRVDDVLEGLNISGFYAGDWIKHLRKAIKRGAGIVAFPPFYKGGYETMFKYINENIEWDAPKYDLYDPEDLQIIMDEVAEAGVPYCILSDQKLKGHEPEIEFHSGRHVPHYCFIKQGGSSYLRLNPKEAPFKYSPIDLSKINSKSKVEIVECPADWVTFLKNVYLKKSIAHTPGMANFLVLINGMLAGALIYSLSKYGARGSIYLLSDFSITREAKVSKMIAKMSLSQVLIDVLNKRYIDRFYTVLTTAFSPNFVSMKYRGVFTLTSRRKSDTNENENILNYSGEVIPDTPQQIYNWWWTTHGSKTLG